MSTLGRVRYALAIPPGEAMRKARRLARMRASELGQILRDARGQDPLAPAARRALAPWESQPELLFRAGATLPLEWPAADRAAVAAEAEASTAAANVPGAGGVAGAAGAASAAGGTALPWADATSELLASVRFAAGQALAHRFDLLGAGGVRVDYGLEAPGIEGRFYRMAPGEAAAAEQLARMERLLAGSVPADYAPIDWHVDFRSGWRWSPATWYGRVDFGHVSGADIKAPWELSRLQHVGALGLAWRLLTETAEGQAAPGEFRAQVVDWLAANPLRRGVNWACSMDVALRAVSWLAGVALMDSSPALTPDFRVLLARALRLHGLHIEGNLEYDPERTSNHYLADVLGLLALGAALPQLPEADRWLAFGLQEVASEARRQILPDGAQIEGSTSYHAFVLEMFLTAAAIARRLPASRRERLLADWPSGAGDRRRRGAPALAPLAAQALDLRAEPIFSPEITDRFLAAAHLAADLLGDDGLLPQVGDHDSGRVWKLLPHGVPGAAPEGGWREEPRDARQVLALAGALHGDALLAAAGAPYELHAALLAPRDGAGSSCSASAAIRLGRPDGPDGSLAVFPAGGLAVGRAGGLHLLASFGQMAREVSGGHYHNDVLSFELAWRGERFVVDGGSYLYSADAQLRDAFRRTAAHSTITVAGREQRGWPPAAASLFRVTADVQATTTHLAEPGRLEVECRYFGVVHRRAWRWSDLRLEISDSVQADAPAELVLNLAPAVHVEEPPRPEGDGVALVLRAGDVRAHIRMLGVSDVCTRPGFYSAGYGRRVANVALAAPIAGEACHTVIEFEEAEVMPFADGKARS